MARKYARQGNDAEESESETDTAHRPTHNTRHDTAVPGHENGYQQQSDQSGDQARPRRTGGDMSITSMLSHPSPPEQGSYNHGYEGHSHHPGSHHTHGQLPPPRYDTARSNGNSRGRRSAGR